MGSARALADVQFTFGRYETMFRIGAGGMAEVFAARLVGEAGFERLVAIKRLLPHLAEDPQYVARFLDEGRLAARVVHPHVVQTLDLGRTDEGEPFLVLELVVGSSLDELIRQDPRPPVPVLLSWLAQSAEGLHAAHLARAPDGTPLGMVHRDVSPHNILVGLDGDARIGDFGIAHAALLKSARTPTGQVTGKFAYFSPEQACGRPLDARSDVFSLGVVAWEALTGQRLFDADAPAQIIDRVRTLDIPPPHRLRSDVPSAVSEVVLAALARDLDERTPNAQAFARELSATIRDLSEPPTPSERSRWVRSARDSMWQRLGSNTDAGFTQAAPTRSRRWPKRVQAVVVATLSSVSAAWFAAQATEDKPAAPTSEHQDVAAREAPAAPPPVFSAGVLGVSGPTPQAGTSPLAPAPSAPEPRQDPAALPGSEAATVQAVVKGADTRNVREKKPSRITRASTTAATPREVRPLKAAPTPVSPRPHSALLGADAFERNLAAKPALAPERLDPRGF